MKKILIVDDSPFIRQVLKGIVEKVVPDLVLLDIIMPEGEDEGVDVLRQIKDADPQARIIMISAVGHDAMIDRCKKLGVLDYIVKPFDDVQIDKLLKKYL